MRTDTYANGLLVIVTVFAALGWLFSVHVLSALSPLLFLTIRFLSAACIVGAANPRQVLTLPRRWQWRALVTGALLGVQTAVWVMAITQAEGIGVGAFLMSLSFILIPLTGLLFGYRAKRLTWLALLIALPGLGLLAFRHGFAVQQSDILFLVSAILYALYFNINGKLCATIPPVAQTCYQLFAASVVFTAGFLLFETGYSQSLQSVWLWLLLSILVATCLRFFLMLKAQTMAPEGQGAVVMTLEPVWVALLGGAFLGEQFDRASVAGMILIFLALVVNAFGSYRQRRKLLQAND
ncbi:DMT family transporter [Alteromonas pelagimontana]|uniref:DMT family transporter n=1 Tax=Alteromonas pelagimontana TaxID=1858656 RepID=A0A6M4MEZ3_9ALTE|nr:DMT family transporter [Alteromonas pelagimontana]QJR81175.1 DMT family transporter [Alteromonas pelagimontana]